MENPVLAYKEEMQKEILSAFDLPDAVLQGGGALHHIHGLPRLSVDLDYVIKQMPELAVLQASYEKVATAANLDRSPEIKIKGKLARLKFHKILNPAQRIVVPVELFIVPAYTAQYIKFQNSQVYAETPLEILANKYVANMERIEKRNSIKLRDLYDMWFITTMLKPDLRGLGKLITAKCKDNSVENRPEKVRNYLDSLIPELLEESFSGYLPADAESDAKKILEKTKEIYEEKW